MRTLTQIYYTIANDYNNKNVIKNAKHKWTNNWEEDIKNFPINKNSQ